jgi:predicted nucleotidyltransferase
VLRPGEAAVSSFKSLQVEQILGKTTNNVDVQELTGRLRRELPPQRDQYAIQTISLFGSYVRGEQKRGSDLDILVEFTEVPGMFRFLDLERDLAHLLGVPVDLVQKEALKPAIGKRIMREIHPV